MTTALAIGLVLAAWLVLPFPLAVLVGRSLREGRLPASSSPPDEGTRADLTGARSPPTLGP